MRRSVEARGQVLQVDLFANFNGLPDDNARTEFYQHHANWANRMLLATACRRWCPWSSAGACAARGAAHPHLPIAICLLHGIKRQPEEAEV